MDDDTAPLPAAAPEEPAAAIAPSAPSPDAHDRALAALPNIMSRAAFAGRQLDVSGLAQAVHDLADLLRRLLGR